MAVTSKRQSDDDKAAVTFFDELDEDEKLRVIDISNTLFDKLNEIRRKSANSVIDKPLDWGVVLAVAHTLHYQILKQMIDTFLPTTPARVVIDMIHDTEMLFEKACINLSVKVINSTSEKDL